MSFCKNQDRGLEEQGVLSAGPLMGKGGLGEAVQCGCGSFAERHVSV